MTLDAFDRIADAVTSEIVHKTQGAKESGTSFFTAVTTVIENTVRRTSADRSDSIWAAKAIVVGVLRSAGENEGMALRTLSHAARIAVRKTALLGGNLEVMTKGILLGAIMSAELLAMNRENALSAAAQGTLEGGREAGSVASERVRDALKRSMDAVLAA
jgi:hypothetical protein